MLLQGVLEAASHEPSTLSQILAVVSTVVTIAIPVFGTYMIAKLNRVQSVQAALVDKQATMEKQQDTIHALVNDASSRQREMIASLEATIKVKDNLPGTYERVVEVERLLHEQNLKAASGAPAAAPVPALQAQTPGGVTMAVPVKVVGQDETLPVKIEETPPKKNADA